MKQQIHKHEDAELKNKKFLFKWSEKMSDRVRADALEERRTIGSWLRDAIEKKLNRKALTTKGEPQ